MPEVKFEMTTNGIQVPTLEGRQFCSGRDPIREARTWFGMELPFLINSTDVLVLGLGAGFHIQEILWSEHCPHQLWVVEKNGELVDLWKKENKHETRNQKIQFLSLETDFDKHPFREALILEFRPAWTGNDEFYQQLSKNLRGPSIKEKISQLSALDQTQPAKIWRALRELVR